jgi:hypothetical protein
MRRIRTLTALSAVLALGVAACSDSTSSTGDPLTQAEAEDLAALMVEGGLAGFAGIPTGGPQAAPGEAGARVTLTINETGECSIAGGVTLDGEWTIDVNDETGDGTFEWDYSVDPNNCQEEAGSGVVFTLNGDPNVAVQGDLNWSGSETGGTLEGALDYSGGIAWTTDDDRAGTCGVDITATYDITWNNQEESGSGTVTVSGSVCGVSVDNSVTWEY